MTTATPLPSYAERVAYWLREGSSWREPCDQGMAEALAEDDVNRGEALPANEVDEASALTFGSLFSGIGGFDLGLERAGFTPVFQCDNDPFCNKVLAKHWPGVKRYDDVQAIRLLDPEVGTDRRRDTAGARGELPRQPRGGDVAAAPEAGVEQFGHVDLICGGFPCQDLSVAGKRAGLDGARSGLWFEFHRILSELRPAACLIENVPGLLSSNQGRDFGVILAGLEQLWPGRWGWAVLDSQHFGVPQRRRRLYVIAGPPRERIAQILSLCESGDWNTQARRAEREDVAGTLSGGAHPGGFNGQDAYANQLVANTLLDKTGRLQVEETFVLQDAREVEKQQNGLGVERSDVMYTLDGASQHAVGVTIHGTDKTARVASYTEIAGSLRTKPPGTQENSSTTAVHERLAVRRLTPGECERLQGFPDDWTKVDDKTPDGPRYKACGNAVTVPVIEYLCRRIAEVLVEGLGIGIHRRLIVQGEPGFTGEGGLCVRVGA